MYILIYNILVNLKFVLFRVTECFMVLLLVLDLVNYNNHVY